MYRIRQQPPRRHHEAEPSFRRKGCSWDLKESVALKTQGCLTLLYRQYCSRVCESMPNIERFERDDITKLLFFVEQAGLFWAHPIALYIYRYFGGDLRIAPSANGNGGGKVSGGSGSWRSIHGPICKTCREAWDCAPASRLYSAPARLV